MDSEILIKQDKMSSGFFSAWIVAMTTIQWITLDMYLPALPILKEQLGISEGVLNISLNAGILTTAIGTLIGGSISDRFGRKAVVGAGMLISAAGTLACAAAQEIVFLSVMRGIAGFGSGIIETVTAAMVKDSYSGKKFQSTITVLQSTALIGPLCAPSLGALLINIGSWRLIFVALFVMMVISAIPLFMCKETLPKENRQASRISDVLIEGKRMCRDSFFVIFAVIMALITMPVWAYIGESSYVFINEFGESNTMYGLYYAIGSVISLIAPFIYMFLARKIGVSNVVSIIIALLIISGATMISEAGQAPSYS
ncbi:MAG: MFS transporter [Firmicutes bacterium]|nr:MFS transporter [Bacillota bacterium]